MAAELGEAFVPIRATLDKLDGDLAAAKGKIQGALGGLGDGLKSAGGLALAGVLGVTTAAVGGLAAGLGIAINEAMGAQQVMAQTEAVIKSTGGAAGMTAQQVADLATALSTQSRFSDDAIQSGENLLLTFTNIGSDVFPAASQAMIDLAQSMGTDASAGAIQLGKALNDPTQGITALTRVGVSFSDEQKKLIKHLQDTGDMAGAQQIILAELTKEFGGSAAAAAATFGGKLDVVKNQLLNVAEAIGGPLLTIGGKLIDTFLIPAVPVLEKIGAAITDFLDTFTSGDFEDPIGALANLLFTVANALGLDGAGVFGAVIQLRGPLDDLIANVQAIIAVVTPIVASLAAWLAANVNVQDVLITLGVAIAAVVIPALVSIVSAVAPVILAVAAVMAIVVLLRQAWESDFGGIQEKTAAAWAVVQPLLAQAVQWLSVNVPIALEALRAWWVDVAWPAIQNAVAVAWPIIQSLFAALVSFVTGTLIPTVESLWSQWVNVWWPAIVAALQTAWANIQPVLAAIGNWIVNTLIPTVVNLWTQWTTVWWPAIHNAVTNAWTVIVAVFNELDRWINVNIVPWIQFLQKTWATEVWPAISKALNDAWVIIKPIWESFQTWLGVTLPPLITGLQSIFGAAMTGISDAVSPVKSMWDAFTKAVSDFWNWISSHTFSFAIHLPDLPDWAVPGSPLPIHTAWANFARDMARTTIAPQFNLDAMLPAASIVGQDNGSERAISFSSTTTVNTSRDPMRVLRASRHLDKLGALL